MRLFCLTDGRQHRVCDPLGSPSAPMFRLVGARGLREYLQLLEKEFRKLANRVTSSPVAWGGVMTLLRGVGFLVVMAYALKQIPTQEIGLWYVMLSIAGLG